jgi:hypothetical protein
LEGAGVAAGATRDEQTKIAEQPRSRQREGQDEQRAEQGVVKEDTGQQQAHLAGQPVDPARAWSREDRHREEPQRRQPLRATGNVRLRRAADGRWVHTHHDLACVV